MWTVTQLNLKKLCGYTRMNRLAALIATVLILTACNSTLTIIYSNEETTVAGKGSAPRKDLLGNQKKKFDENWDKIFNKGKAAENADTQGGENKLKGE